MTLAVGFDPPPPHNAVHGAVLWTASNSLYVTTTLLIVWRHVPLYCPSELINPRRACAARVTVLSLSVCVCVCVCVCECVCYLANRYAVNAQVQSKIRIECKCATKGF